MAVEGVPPDDFRLPADVAEELRQALPSVVADILQAVVVESPVFADPFVAELGANVEAAIHTALSGFLDVVAGPSTVQAGVEIDAMRQASYQLGRNEARSGRSMDALTAAYRVGARVAWRRWSAADSVKAMGVEAVARFAERNYAYIDELADASVSGHSHERASASRIRQRQREQLAVKLLSGSPSPEVLAAAKQAGWAPPDSLVAVVIAHPDARMAIPTLDPDTLEVTEDVPFVTPSADRAALLVPVREPGDRARLLGRLSRTSAAVGPTRPWLQARTSMQLAVRAAFLVPTSTAGPIDTDRHLTQLVLAADPDTQRQQRDQVLAAFAGLKPTTRTRYEETLRSWLLNQGRRQDVADQLFVHPQTVRYRMDKIRELLGDSLLDPNTVLDLVIALA